MCEGILKSIDKFRGKTDDIFFSKDSHSYLDLELSNLKINLLEKYNILIIPNNCVKINLNPLINARARKMATFCSFFSKNSYSYLDLEPSDLKVDLA